MSQHVKDIIGAGRFQEALEAVMAMTPEQQAEHARERAEHERQERERREAEQREAARLKRARTFREWGIPGKDIERIMSGALAQTAAMDWAQRFVDQLDGPNGPNPNARPMLVLAGPMGCGKTTAASWVLAANVKRWGTGQHDAMFVRAGRLVRWNRFDDAAMTMLERIAALVIDDLGSEYQDDKGAFRVFVDNLVDARYADRRATVITTNLDAETFKGRYGARFADRLREAGKFVELDGASMRKGAA